MSEYVIAPKRQARGQVSENWQAGLREIEGVEVVGTGQRRVQVRVTQGALHAVRELLGDGFLIEPLVRHTRDESE